MEIPLLADIIIILGLAVVVILIFQKLRLPTLLGFLITGIITGPSGMNLVEASHEVEILSEIGVILLLFIIGLEFSLSELFAIKKYVLIGGTTQVLLTILGTSLVGILLLHFSLPQSIFLGFLFALSSTAIVLKLLQERGEVSSPHGKVVLAILIFQDIIIVPMMLLVPMLAGETKNVWLSLLLLALKGILILVVVYFSARYFVPKLLFLITRTKNKELFLLTTVVICFAVAWLTSSMGLSLSLGAFLAGLIISESEYSHQATSNIIPFREIFSSFFFVSIGMLLDLSFFASHISLILFFTFLTFFGKTLISSLAAFILGFPTRTILLVGFSLFQVGEFAFILSKEGLNRNLLPQDIYQYFLSVSLLTMALTPFVILYAGKMSNQLLRFLPTRLRGYKLRPQKQEELLHDHIVIIGFGITGQHVARVARKAGIRYTILELNSETVRRERKRGEPITFGDAVHGVILTHAGIQRARVAVVAISDTKATRQIVANIRQLSSSVYIIARTSFMHEMDDNFRLGADEVIPEELETSIEIFTRVLTRYLVPKDEILDFITRIRTDNYDMMRSPTAETDAANVQNFNLTNMAAVTLRVQHDKPGIVGETLEKSGIRQHYSITVLAINRENDLIEEVTNDTEILLGDLLYVFGRRSDIVKLEKDIGLKRRR